MCSSDLDGRIQVGTPTLTPVDSVVGTNNITVYDSLAYNTRYIMVNLYNSAGGVTTMHVDNGVGQGLDFGVLSTGRAFISADQAEGGSLECAGGNASVMWNNDGCTRIWFDYTADIQIDPAGEDGGPYSVWDGTIDLTTATTIVVKKGFIIDAY